MHSTLISDRLTPVESSGGEGRLQVKSRPCWSSWSTYMHMLNARFLPSTSQFCTPFMTSQFRPASKRMVIPTRLLVFAFATHAGRNSSTRARSCVKVDKKGMKRRMSPDWLQIVCKTFCQGYLEVDRNWTHDFHSDIIWWFGHTARDFLILFFVSSSFF